jgi:cytochrome c553
MHRLIATVVVAGTAALAPATSLAGSTPGRLLASNCFQCHGTDGRPAAGLAKLAGESASSTYNKMRELRAKTGPDSIMNAHVRGYTDLQLWALSA